ncbi:MFS transporter [Klebsiella pneumoniae]|nr:MFS transporter [Klebsiella pneumoniae]
MVLHSTRWLALSYFTYFFSYGIFLPFWSVWLAGNGLTPETIGILLGAGLVARFLGSLLIAPRVSDPSRLIAALRVLALLTLLFALSKKVFRRFSARDLLLLSAACGLIRWGLMGWTTALPGLILAQILHCGTFTVCHLAAMRYIAARQGSEVIRLQAVYSAVAMGGSIAIMTVFAGFLYQHLHQGVFWVMALLTLPAMAIRPKAVAA